MAYPYSYSHPQSRSISTCSSSLSESYPNLNDHLSLKLKPNSHDLVPLPGRLPPSPVSPSTPQTHSPATSDDQLSLTAPGKSWHARCPTPNQATSTTSVPLLTPMNLLRSPPIHASTSAHLNLAKPSFNRALSVTGATSRPTAVAPRSEDQNSYYSHQGDPVPSHHHSPADLGAQIAQWRQEAIALSAKREFIKAWAAHLPTVFDQADLNGPADWTLTPELVEEKAQDGSCPNIEALKL